MEKIIEMLLNYVEPDDEITAETELKADLAMSSFDLVCLSNDVLDEFGVKLTADDFRKCDTVGKLTALIESKS